MAEVYANLGSETIAIDGINSTGQLSTEPTPASVIAKHASTGALSYATSTLHTVTGGKSFYLTSLTMYIVAGAGSELNIRDNATVKQKWWPKIATAEIYTWTFPTPIKFDTSVVLYGQAVTTGEISLTGYEA